MASAVELLFSQDTAASVKKAKIALICGETATPKLIECFTQELARNGFENVTPVQCGNYQFSVDLTFDLAIALNCTLAPLSKCIQFNGKLITAEVSGSLFRLFVDLGRNHRFDVHLSGDRPRGTEFNRIHPGTSTVVVCDRHHGLRTGQMCEISVNLPQFQEGYTGAVEVLTDKTFTVDIDTSNLAMGGHNDPRTGERIVQVSGFVRPASSLLSASFESLASQLRKHPKFDACNAFETKELKKCHALLNTYLGYCSYSRKKGLPGSGEDFAQSLSSGQADFGSLFDICFLQAEDIESAAKRFNLFGSISELTAINRLAASLTISEAVKAVSHKLEPLQQWLILDLSDFSVLENISSQLGEKETKVLIVSGVTSLGEAVKGFVSEQVNFKTTVIEDTDKSPIGHDESYLDNFDVVIAAGVRDHSLDSLRRKLVTKSKPLIAIRFGGPGELISSVDVTVPGQTDLPQDGDSKQLSGGSFVTPPHCVVKNFPNQVSHCIIWAIDKFESLFRSKPEICNKFVEEASKSSDSSLEVSSASTVLHFFFNNPSNFDDCLYMARVKFEKYFDFKARQLVFNFPPDHKTEDGKRFWVLPRQLPRPLDFDELVVGNGQARQFLVSAAELFATVYGVTIPDDVDKAVSDFIVSDRCKHLPNFTPKQKRIDTNENEDGSRERSPIRSHSNGDVNNSTEATVEKAMNLVRNMTSKRSLHLVEPLRSDRRTCAAFRFVAATAALRGSMYGVGSGALLPGQLAKFVAAGRVDISVADATWTLPAVEYGVAELATAELQKIVAAEKQDQADASKFVDSFRNSEMNFSKSLYIKRFPPKSATVQVLNEKCSFTVWDKWHYEAMCNETTVAKFIELVESQYGVKITAIAQGARPVYFPFMGHKRERFEKPLFDFVDHSALGKGQVAQLVLLLEPPPSASCMDAEDIESPPVFVRFH